MILVVGGVLGWWTLRQALLPMGQLPKGLAETALYQGQIVRLREALAAAQSEAAPLPSTDAREVYAALTGKNPQGKVFLDAKAFRLSPGSQPLDPWGREFVFERREGKIGVVAVGAPTIRNKE